MYGINCLREQIQLLRFEIICQLRSGKQKRFLQFYKQFIIEGRYFVLISFKEKIDDIGYKQSDFVTYVIKKIFKLQN